MLRALSILLASAALAQAQTEDAPPPLLGTVANGVYTAPTGAYKIEIPVLPELGGAVHDTRNVVTFRDSFGLQISIGAFEHDATLKWQLSTRGMKDYLIYFFSNFVLTDFRQFCPGTRIESAGFSTDLMDGSLFTYILLPGGSVFADQLGFQTPGAPPVAKRGNMLFVKNGFTYVISTELSERVTEGSRYAKTTDEENVILRKRLQNIATNMVFLTAPAPATPSVPPATPSVAPAAAAPAAK
jgi:hypothetical protein